MRATFRPVLLSFFAMLIVAEAPRAAMAGPKPAAGPSFHYLDNDLDEVASAAFSTPFGRLLVAEFAAVLADSADAACLSEKGIDKAAVADRARAILLRRGAQMGRKAGEAVDRATFDAKFAARKGRNANAELGRLRNDPAVREYIALRRPAALADTALLVLENLGRYALIQRIKLVRPVSPVEAVNTAILDLDPSDEANEKADDFVAKSKSRALKRYLELVEAAEAARKESISVEVAFRIGPAQLMSGFDQDLADVCVIGRF
jgi:hypothetical protein